MPNQGFLDQLRQYEAYLQREKASDAADNLLVVAEEGQESIWRKTAIQLCKKGNGNCSFLSGNWLYLVLAELEMYWDAFGARVASRVGRFIK